MDRQRVNTGLRSETGNRLGTRWVCVLTLLVLLTTYGCDTKNPGPNLNPNRMTLDVSVPSNMFGGGSSTWSATWLGGTAPYTLAWDMGGGAHENTVLINDAVSPQSQNFCMVYIGADGTYTYTVTVTDSTGQTATSSRQYDLGVTRNSQPRIDEMTFQDGVLSVYVSDIDDDQLVVSIFADSHYTINQNSKVAEPLGDIILTPCDGFVGVATFAITLNFGTGQGGGSNMIEVMVVDGNGGSSSETFLINIEPFLLQPDTLYALALGSSVAIDAPITILIATGETAQPFHFMLGMGVVLDSDASYVEDTFNVGAVGGDTADADGVWEDITSDGGFILGPDSLIIPGANPADSLGTSNRFDFNISPLGGVDVASVEGELFNFQVSYSAAGEKTVSFQEVNGVNRTYYTDIASGEDRFWNAYEGATIDVS